MIEEIKKTVDVLKKGGLILYPTDTIWGIGCDATNEDAVKKVYELKQRAESKSLIVLIEDERQLNRYVAEVPAIARELLEVADRPMTIVYPNVYGLAKNVIAEDKSAAIRIPHDDFCKKLLQQFKKPIVSTSANLSGEKAPGSFREISEQIKKKVDHIVNWRQNDIRIAQPSSIIKIHEKGNIEIIRK